MSYDFRVCEQNVQVHWLPWSRLIQWSCENDCDRQSSQDMAPWPGGQLSSLSLPQFQLQEPTLGWHLSPSSVSSCVQGFPSFYFYFYFFCWVSSLVKKQELHLLESSPSELLHGLCPVLAAWYAPQEAAGREDTLIYFAWIRTKKHFSKAVQVIRSQLITKSSKNREKSIENTNELQISCICLQKSSF